MLFFKQNNKAPWPSGKAQVCKTSIPRSESEWRLQNKKHFVRGAFCFGKLHSGFRRLFACENSVRNSRRAERGRNLNAKWKRLSIVFTTRFAIKQGVFRAECKRSVEVKENDYATGVLYFCRPRWSKEQSAHVTSARWTS